MAKSQLPNMCHMTSKNHIHMMQFHTLGMESVCVGRKKPEYTRYHPDISAIFTFKLMIIMY